MQVTVHARSVLDFYKNVSGDWIYRIGGSEGLAPEQGLELSVPTDTGQKITLTNRQTGVIHKFYNFDGQSHAGMPYQVADTTGATVDYVLGGTNGKVITKIIDVNGREINFSYNSILDVTDISYGQRLKVEFTYDAGYRLRKINVRRDYNGDSAWTSAVNYYWYDSNDRLRYHVAPQQYDGLPSTPTEAEVSAAAVHKWTYDANRRTTEEISPGAACTSCSASPSGIEYVHTLLDSDPDDLNTAARKVEHFFPTDEENDPSVVSEVNEIGLLLKETSKADQSQKRIIKHTYNSAAQPTHIYEYDADDPNTPLHVTRLTYDSSSRVIRQETSQTGSSWTKVTEYAYSDSNWPYRPTTIKYFENTDGTGVLQTDLEYYAPGNNGAGFVKKITYPQVNHNYDEAGGSAYRAVEEFTYDSSGQQATTTDEDGMVTKYVYANADGVNNDGDAYTDETDEWGGQLVEVVRDYGTGRLNLTEVEYEYDNNTLRIASQKDALGNETTYGYNDNGDLTSVTYPGGLYVKYVYDKNGRRIEEQKKTSSAGTLLAKSKWGYNVWGQLTVENRYFGTGDTDYARTNYNYDANGRMYRSGTYKDKDISFAAIEQTSFVENTNLVKTVKRGSYDGTTYTLVTTTSYKYDVSGNLVEETDEVNAVTTTYAYDWRGNRTSVTGPEGYYVAYTYDNLGRVTETKRYDTSAQGTLLAHSKTYYDEMGRAYKSEVVNPGDTETAAVNSYYSKGDQLKKGTDPYSKSTTHAYDTAGRQTVVADALGNETVTAYYADGRVKYTQQKNKIATDTYVTYSTGYWYDSDGRLTDTAEYGTGSLPGEWPSSAPASSDTVHVTSYTYDKLGRTTKVTDPEGMEMTFAYDMLSRKTQEVADAAAGGLQIKATFKYDQWDATDSVYYDVIEAWEDASTHQDTAYWYGAAKHPYAVTKTVYPDAGEVTVTYNDDGTVNTGADQREWTVTHIYDDARRVTAEAVSGTGLVGTTAVAYAYDALGRPTSVTDNNDPGDSGDNSTVEWAYTREADGDLKVEETQKYGTMTDRTVTYEYDLSGRLKSMQYPSAMTLTYAYDDLGRVTAVNDGTNDRVADTWKGWLLQKREYASGAYLTYLDDQGGQLSGYGYDTFGGPKNHRWRSSGGSLLSGWNHDYDRIGNKKYQEDLQAAAQSELYGYDGVYRLTSFKRGQLNQDKTDITSPTRTQTWGLDPLGNWDSTVIDGSSESRAHNSVNELATRTVGQDPQISLTYDAAGNLIQDGDSEGSHQYVWDYRNRLIEAQEKQSDQWVTTAEYKYDGRSRRVLKTVTNKGDLNGATRFLWGGPATAGWQCLEERDANGDLVARYTYSPGYIDAVAVQERDLNSDDDFADSGEVVYYHANTLASVYALSDSNESVIERYRYDAYGGVTVLDPNGSVDGDGVSDVLNPYVFTGRRLDLESGLMQYRNRYYSPTLGRFVSRDPEGYVDGFSLYEYAQSAPLGLLDPYGFGAGDFFRAWGSRMGRGARRVGGGVRSVAGRAKRGAQRVGGGIVNWGLTGETNPSQEAKDAAWQGFKSHWGGWDIQIEGGIACPFLSDGGVVYGKVVVSCCDENDCRHRVTLKKTCRGFAAGFWASGHALGNITGTNCPEAYRGTFVEWGVGLGVAGVSGFAGIDCGREKRVTGGGPWVGACLPVSFLVCEYVIEKDEPAGRCGSLK